MKQQHKSDERGVAQLLLIVVIVVVVAAIGYVGWKVVSNKNSKNSTTTSSTPAQSASANAAASAAQTACLAKYHDQDLCKFVAAEAAAPFGKTALKMTMTGTSGGTQGTWTLEQDGKGNSSLSVDSGGQTINAITLNGQVYTQTTAGGSWITYGSSSSASSAAAQSNPDSTLTSFLSGLSTTTFTKLGKEACGSLTCFKYQIKDTTTPNATEYVWFDTGQHLMRQYYASGVSGTSDTLTMTINYQPVTITKPSPVQDISTPAAQ